MSNNCEPTPLCHRVIGPNMFKDEVGKAILPQGIHVFLVQDGGMPPAKNIHVLQTDGLVQYDAFCDDFGPMNAHSMINFVELLQEVIDTAASKNVDLSIVYRAANGARPLTNAAFLLGAYMILKLDLPPSLVSKSFIGLNPKLFEPFRDASFSKPDFGLSLMDCWEGLEGGKNKGWIARPNDTSPCIWGLIDKDAYAHHDDPLNADLHEVIPKKIVAFRGPRDLGGAEFRNNFKDGEFVNRDFSPEYYADVLSGLGVSTVVQLNDAEYDTAAFKSHNIEHFNLHMDCRSTPPPHLVTRFFKIVDEAKGSIAVHGRGGLGCTGTLIALYLMRAHGFSARQAISWVRIMRPGSIIGEQQHYLTDLEQSIRRLVAAAGSPPASPSLSAARRASWSGSSLRMGDSAK